MGVSRTVQLMRRGMAFHVFARMDCLGCQGGVLSVVRMHSIMQLLRSVSAVKGGSEMALNVSVLLESSL